MSGRRVRVTVGGTLEIVWTDRALADLQDIHDYIASDDPEAADRWIEKIFAAVELASTAPASGRFVPEKRRFDMREVLLRSYRIVYRVRADNLEVLTVFEGHRRFPRGVR